MEKIDIFKQMLLAQQEGLTKILAQANIEKSMAGTTMCAILESEKRMVENFIVLVDLLPEKK